MSPRGGDRLRFPQRAAVTSVVRGAVARTTSDWGPIAARARGLLQGVQTPEQIHALAARSLRELVEGLVAQGTLPAGTPDDAVAVDLAVTRRAATRLATLARWGVLTRVPIDGLIAAHEVEMLRTLLRGAASHAPAAWRLAALVPTPALPRRWLEHAAQLDTPERVLALLVSTGHFTGAPALAAWRRAGGTQAVRHAEHAMAVAWGARFATPDAIQAADAPLRAWLRDEAWLLTLWMALAAQDEPLEDALVVPIPGAEALPPSLMRLSVRDDHDAHAAVRSVLAAACGESLALAAAVDAAPGEEEAAARQAQRRQYAAWAQRAPVSSAPVIHVMLSIIAERAAVSAAAFACATRSAP